MVSQYIKRKLEPKVLDLTKKFPIVTVLGTRQAGKTTLLRQLFPDYDYVTFESPDVRTQVVEDPRGFLDQYRSSPVIFDEIQQVPELTPYLQEYADLHYSLGQVLMTGSQQLPIFETISQSLAGRTALLQLHPFSLEELPQDEIPQSLEDLLLKGFFPAIYDRQLSHLDWYPSYYLTYLERDVRQLLNVGNIEIFKKFITLLSGRAGQLLNLNALGIEAGVSQPTARKWFSVLRATQSVFTLAPFFWNINKRIVKMPKVYFADSGLLCYLMGIVTTSDLQVHPLRGAIFENFVMAEFHKYASYTRTEPKFYFFRDKSGHEVDLIIQHTGRLDALEIKYTYTIQKDHFRHLNYLMKYLDLSTSSVFYAGNQKFPDVLSWFDLKKISTLPMFSL